MIDTKIRKQKMLKMRHKDLMTLREIGDHFGISRERVRQIVGNQGHAIHTRSLEERNKYIKTSQKTNLALAKELNLSPATISAFDRCHHKIDGGAPKKGEVAERYINEKLDSLNIKNKLMPTSYKFDILVEKSCRVDVKSAYKESKTSPTLKSPQWHFKIDLPRRGNYCDFFILIVWDSKDCFIIPSSIVPNNMTDIAFCWPTKRPKIGKYQKFHNRWDLLTLDAAALGVSLNELLKEE